MAGLNRAYKRRPNAVALNGAPVLCLDAGSTISYPGTGTTWTDLSGNANNGTLVNGPTFDSANGGSLVFDGVNDYASLPNGVLTGTGDFTVNQFIKAASGETGGTTFGNYPSGNLQIFFGSTYMGIWLGNSSTYLTAPIPFTTNWVMITALRTGTTTAFYINTTLQKNGSSAFTIGDSSRVFRIGDNTSSSGNEKFNGNISVTQVYNRALSATEIATNFELLRGRYGV